MASLSFDVLKWLNTLELKKVPRNLKHDLSTGHIVAEIISRYFSDSCTPEDLSEGHIMRDRRENWKHIERCLRNINFPFPEDWKDHMDAVCETTEGSQTGACAILVYLYEFITKKTARHPTRCDKPKPFRQNSSASGRSTTRTRRDIPIVTRAPQAVNHAAINKERDKKYQIQFVTRVVTFAEIAQTTLAFLQKTFLDMDTKAYIGMVEKTCNIQGLSGVVYNISEYVQHIVCMKKRYIQVVEEACFMPDLSIDSIINDIDMAKESIRTVFHIEYLRLLEQKIDIIVEAASLSLESELFMIFAFCSTYSLTLSTLIFGALQSFLTNLFTAILYKLKEDNLQSTQYLEFIVHSLFSYLPTSIFAQEPTSQQRFSDPVTLAMERNDIYGPAMGEVSSRNFFSLGLSIGYISSPMSPYGVVYPSPSYNTARQIGPIEFVAHCMAIILSIFPRSGIIMLNNYLFSQQNYLDFEMPNFSSKDYLASQIENATEEYNLVKQIIAENKPISFLTQQKLAFLLATLKSMSKLQILATNVSLKDLMKLLEYFSFFANQAFTYKTNNTRPNNFAITRTCATTRDCVGLCTQIWGEICQLMASYLASYSDLKTTTFETIIMDCEEGSKSILSVLVRSTHNLQRILTGLSTKQIKKLAGKISAGNASGGRRSASSNVVTNEPMTQRSTVIGSSLSLFRKAPNTAPRREPQLTSLTTHISLGLRRIVQHFVQHESVFVIRSFVRSLAVILTETYRVINTIVDMCIQIYTAHDAHDSRDGGEAIALSTRVAASTAKPIISKSSASVGTPRKKPESSLSTRDIVAARSMNGIYKKTLNIGTVDDLLKVLEKGTSEHLVLNGIHSLILDTQQIMSECTNMVFLLEEEIINLRNPDLFGNVLEFDPDELDEFPVLETHRRIFDAFVGQASIVGCVTLRSLTSPETSTIQVYNDRYSSITPGGNILGEHSSGRSRGSSAPGSKPVSARSRVISEHLSIRKLKDKDRDGESGTDTSTSNTSSIVVDDVKDVEDVQIP